MTYTPTSDQLKAISARGQNILVNAGAGAGKTATLIERVYRLITGEHDPVSLENMLIVTFTRAAATEMKERLAGRLHHELAQAWAERPDSEHARRLQSQLAILPRAPISTLHSFCLRLLRENAGIVGLPPDFDLMSEEEARLIHREHIDNALEETLKDPAGKQVLFEMLEQLPPDPSMKAIAGMVRRLHGFLQACADPEGFVTRVLSDYEEAANPALPFDEKRLGRQVRQAVFGPVWRVTEAMDIFFQACPGYGIVAKGPKEYWDSAAEVRETLRKMAASFESDRPLPDFDSFLRLPRRTAVTKNSTPQEREMNAQSALLKEVMDDARKELGGIDPEISLEGLLAQVASTTPYVRLLLERLGLHLLDALMAHHMQLRRLTYAHLERLALRVLRTEDGSPTEAALKLREEFNYVLVDEFQDVNELQARLLAAVARPGDAQSGGNLFVVGDVKQSIYGFRQADPRQFLELHKQYADYDPASAAHPGARINLRENFRSQPALLHTLNSIFAALFSERIGQVLYDDSHAFVPGRCGTSANGACVEVHLIEKHQGADDAFTGDGDDREEDESEWLESDEAEARYVAKLIRECGHPLKEIAVLLRSASGYATKLVDALQSAGIPFFTQESIGFLSQQEIVDVMSLLRVIDNPYEEVSLIGCLRGPAAEWSEDDLVRLRMFDRHARLFDNLKRIAESDHLLQHAAADFLAQLRAWQDSSRREGMGAFFGRLYTDISLRERVATLPNGNQRLNNLQFLQDRGVQFDSFRRKGLAQFLCFLDDLIERGEDLGQPALVSPETNVVRIMTIHKSKGLEFPVVIFPFLGRRFNRQDLNENAIWDRDGGFGVRFLPGRKYGEMRASLAKQLLLPVLEDRLRSEELRLFYVAMTRAREKLILTGTASGLADKILRHQETSALPAGELQKKAAAAMTFLDWTLLSISSSAEFAQLSGEQTRAASNQMILQLIPDASRAEDLEVADSAVDSAEQLQRLELARPALEEALQRIARRMRRSDVPIVRAKVSATEAKRAYESLHSAENPPAHPARRAWPKLKEELPSWWPPALAQKHQDGRTKGTLTHRLCALLDLDNVARGATVQQELDRLVNERYFTPEEEGVILVSDLQDFFDRTALGRRVLDNRATVLRELPFTVAVPVQEIAPQFPAQGEKLIFQGIVDLFFTQKSTTGEQTVLLDFKTDYWDGTPAHFEQLEQSYRPQMHLYRLGLERALGRPVDETWLYFLRAQQPLLIDRPTEEQWHEYLRAAYLQESSSVLPA